ncbi:MAG: CPXCG motif-containing cysteine-rich protein [Gammaproteobacteria bacterium]|nr:CPXCG motif-containing cysteine-rich protein [Gammaproteobacteria bacterium]
MEPIETVALTCPYCGEPGEIDVEPALGSQEYVEDCGVCCRPWQVHVTVDESGAFEVSATREDDA